MTVAMARDSWTDERLDDLSDRVGSLERRMDQGFKETREEFRAVRSEMREEFHAVRAEMAAMHRTLVQVMLSGFAIMLAGFAGTIATILATNG